MRDAVFTIRVCYTGKMSLHAFLVLALTVISAQILQTGASPVLTEAQCTLPPRERTDCGFGGIGEQECNRKGCCFDSRIPGVIWCYKVPRPVVPEIVPEPQVQEPQVDPVPHVQEPQVDPVPQVQEPQVDPMPQVQEPQVDPVPQVQEPQVDEPEVCIE
ncbi:integumentary mucin A.1-like [Hyla sarda]|uniref:integumentary mucin A.1-like n=1 Tax=Hyla sarda TaxID=327740 RepID=UPI0024C43999|nr:integumentary mucin A.1-like [Hyla sarda]